MAFAIKKTFNIFHQALSMLLHYLGKLKFKFADKLDKNTTKMHRFLHAPILLHF